MGALSKILKKAEEAEKRGRWDMVIYYLSQAMELAKLNADTEHCHLLRGVFQKERPGVISTGPIKSDEFQPIFSHEPDCINIYNNFLWLSTGK